MRVAVLYNELRQFPTRDEEDVLVQVEAVSMAIEDLGHVPLSIPFSMDLRDAVVRLRDYAPDLVFNLVESLDGSGRFVHLAPALLDHLGIPYTGAATEAIFLTSNKLLAKEWMEAFEIPTPPWHSEAEHGGSSPFRSGRYIIKSVWEHASVGIEEDSVVEAEDRPDLCRHMSCRRSALKGACFGEVYVDGREFNLSLLSGPSELKVLPAAEIRFGNYPPHGRRLVGYRAKWETGSFEYENTRRRFVFGDSDAPLISRLQDLAARCWKVFALKGYARVDFRVDSGGNPWVLEINANPCLSPDAGFAAAAAVAGLSYSQMIGKIVEASMWSGERGRGPSEVGPCRIG